MQSSLPHLLFLLIHAQAADLARMLSPGQVGKRGTCLEREDVTRNLLVNEVQVIYPLFDACTSNKFINSFARKMGKSCSF